MRNQPALRSGICALGIPSRRAAIPVLRKIEKCKNANSLQIQKMQKRKAQIKKVQKTNNIFDSMQVIFTCSILFFFNLFIYFLIFQSKSGIRWGIDQEGSWVWWWSGQWWWQCHEEEGVVFYINGGEMMKDVRGRGYALSYDNWALGWMEIIKFAEEKWAVTTSGKS